MPFYMVKIIKFIKFICKSQIDKHFCLSPQLHFASKKIQHLRQNLKWSTLKTDDIGKSGIV